MPLFLDLHKAADYEAKPTVEAIKKNHIADLTVQKKYGVRFIQYWINEDEGLVFCLMEGPDKEACAAVHREAHGNMPCNVIELKGGDYQTYMGVESMANAFDIVENPDGTFDSGVRVCMAVDMLTSEKPSVRCDTIRDALKKFHGREVDPQDDRMLFVFNSGAMAVDCAHHILTGFKKYKDTEIQIGISAGHPVTDKDNFFDAVVKLTGRLCSVAGKGQAYIAANVKGLSGKSFTNENKGVIRPVTFQEEKFLNGLLDIIETSIGRADFNVEAIARRTGVSRAQLYRKVISLTGMSPNNFIKELRLRKAMRLILQKQGNVAEVAYETGFSNPSYFSAVFQKRFRQLPSRYLDTIA